MINEKYSNKDFTKKILTDTDPKEWNDTEIVNSCFAQEIPLTNVFPEGIEGVIFIRCNLDNCVIPKNCTVEGGTNKLIQVQKDGIDWIVDNNLNPIEPINKGEFIKVGISIDPTSLSTAETAEVNAIEDKKLQLEAGLQSQIRALEATAYWR